MDATDFAIGIALIAILVWVSIIALNQNASNTAIADLYARTALNKPLISHPDVCPPEPGFELREPGSQMEQYHTRSGYTDFNQSYFCFYKKIENGTGST